MDLCTRRCEIIGMKVSNTQHVVKAIKAFEHRMGYNFKSIHSDASNEFFSNDLLTWLQQRTSTGLPTSRHMAAPDIQWQNGFCERHWGHIKQMAHKMLVNARLPLQFLFYALQTVCYIHARLQHSGLISPTGRVADRYRYRTGGPAGPGPSSIPMDRL
jgi:transposase InsO family protein